MLRSVELFIRVKSTPSAHSMWVLHTTESPLPPPVTTEPDLKLPKPARCKCGIDAASHLHSAWHSSHSGPLGEPSRLSCACIAAGGSRSSAALTNSTICGAAAAVATSASRIGAQRVADVK